MIGVGHSSPTCSWKLILLRIVVLVASIDSLSWEKRSFGDD